MSSGVNQCSYSNIGCLTRLISGGTLLDLVESGRLVEFIPLAALVVSNLYLTYPLTSLAESMTIEKSIDACNVSAYTSAGLVGTVGRP